MISLLRSFIFKYSFNLHLTLQVTVTRVQELSYRTKLTEHCKIIELELLK